MTTKLNEGQKTGIAIAVVAALAIAIAIFLWVRSASASSSATIPIKDPVKPPVDPVPVPPDPYAPTTTPTKGAYYIPVHGDSGSLICQKAGFSNVAAARRKMRDHARNMWIPKVTHGTETEKQLDLDWGYKRMEAYADKDWAWNTKHVASGGLAICIVYIPTDAEVGG